MSDSKCPYHAAKEPRSDLPPLTERIKSLPLDDRGYPIPFFVAYVDGKPEFRAADGAKYRRCIRENLCWVCGQKLSKPFAFLIGPMCAITGTTSEPPTHLDCAEWSAKGCPFLSKPVMVRRENNMPEEASEFIGGIGITRNPGVTCMWITDTYTIFRDPNNRPLIQVGDAISRMWYREGRRATKAEIFYSIETGIPALREVCHNDRDKRDLAMQHGMLLEDLKNWD